MGKLKQFEERDQALLVRWSHLPSVRAVMPLEYLHHSPNGGKRDAFVGAQMRAMGVKSGFPDLIIPVPSAGFAGLAIEMKTKIGRVTPEQSRWLSTLSLAGWRAEVCRSPQEARALICQYFTIDPDSMPPLPDK